MLRIISLIPSATEIIHRLGSGGLLVGVSHECDYPEIVTDLPICSYPRFNSEGNSVEIDTQIKTILENALSIYHIKKEEMSELKPDLIITQSQCDVCAVSLSDVRKSLQEILHINPKIISLEPKKLDDVWDDIRTIAAELNKNDVADEMIDSFLDTISNISNSRENTSGPTVACVEWIEPLMFAGNWVPEMVEIVGGINQFSEKGEHSSWSDPKELFDSDPDIIIFMPCGYSMKKTKIELDRVLSLDGWKDLKSIKSGGAYLVDGSQFFNRPGPRLLDSIKILDEIINGKQPRSYHGIGWLRV